MSKILELTIKNFRGIKELDLKFPYDKNIICFIGRGDSGKTTILEAIDSMLTPKWNKTFYDTDFFNCISDNPIEITAKIVNLPKELISESKLGLYTFGYNIEEECFFNPIDEEIDEADKIHAIEVRLIVDSSLEPKWTIINQYSGEEFTLSTPNRSLLNCFLISDYIDRHFSWSKGNPLHTLLKSSDEGNNSLSLISDAIRKAKESMDNEGFTGFNESTNKVIKEAKELGLNLSDLNTTIDFKDINVKDDKVSLHSNNNIPLRLNGKGSKRLTSIAIQSAVADNGGIVLIDELEQGLEADRAKNAISSLKDSTKGQIFITTHSTHIIEELSYDDLFLIIKETSENIILKRFLDSEHPDIQGAVRACPEGFFANKIIICEGSTEVGICRALDSYRKNNKQSSLAFNNCVFINANGEGNIDKRVKPINELKDIKTAVFCDSDVPSLNSKKSSWENTLIVDTKDNYDIEKQCFNDLPDQAIRDLIDYVISEYKNGEKSRLESSLETTDINLFLSSPIPQENRDILYNRSVKKDKSGKTRSEWFKSIYDGEYLGHIIFKHWNNIDSNSKLKQSLESLNEWVDKV